MSQRRNRRGHSPESAGVIALAVLGALWWRSRSRRELPPTVPDVEHLDPVPPHGASTVRAFPVAHSGGPHFANDFGVRAKGREHRGVDIFAAEGTPVFAVDDGLLSHGAEASHPKGGIVAYVRAWDGTLYYYAHLAALEGPPRRVIAGDLIGYVGMTGNAAGTTPHLHFEMYPPGSRVAVDPYPALLAAKDH